MRVPPAAGVALAVVSVSFAAPLFVLADAGPATASFWRLAFAVVLLLPFTRGCWGVWRGYRLRDWLLSGAAGVALGAHFALWVWSLQHTSVASSTSLVTLQAVFVGLGSHWMGEKMSRRAWFGVMVAIGGALTIAWADGSSGGSIAGDVVALLAGVCSAAYFLVGRRLRAERGLVEYVTPTYAIAALVLLVPMTLEGGIDLFLPATLYFVLLAAVPMLGGHTAANWAIRYIPAHVVATWILLEPLGAALLAWPILGQVPSVWVVVGGTVAVAGAALTLPHRSR